MSRLHVRRCDASGTLHLSDEETPGEAWQRIDLEEAHRAVWEAYSGRLLARCRSCREAAGQTVPGIHADVMEDLLHGIYREAGFPVLLAAEICRRIQAARPPRTATRIQVRLSERFPVPAPLLVRELSRTFPGLEVTPAIGKPAARLLRLMRLLAPLLARIATGINLLVARLQGERPDPQIEPWPDELFAVYPGWSNHSRHVWRYLAQRGREDRPRVVFVLGNALRRTRPDVPGQVTVDGVRFVRPVHGSDLASCYAGFKRAWPAASRLVDAVLNDVSAGPRTYALWLLKTAYFLLNALLVEAYVERLRPGRRAAVVFGLIASPIDTALDRALQRQGLTTVHWLHGIVAFGLQYRAHSTLCLCRSPLERRVRETFGAYGACLSATPDDGEPPAFLPRDDRAGFLLLTNLIHRETPLPREGAAEAELYALLEMTAQVAGAMREPLCWRPHPRERAHRGLFPEAAEAARRLSYAIDGAADLHTRLQTARYVVCTFSTTIADAVQAGVVPVLYAGTPHERVGYWAHLPEALKFRDAAGLRQALDRLSDGSFARAMHRRLAELFHVTARRLPAPGAFAHLARREAAARRPPAPYRPSPADAAF